MRAYILIVAILIALIASGPASAHHRLHKEQRVVAKLNAAFAQTGSPMYGKAWDYIRAGRKHRVNPFFIAAIAGLESTFGKASCAPHNAWGILAHCGSGFGSWAHGIDYASAYIRTRFINLGYSSIWSIGYDYCPPCGAGWGNTIAGIMRYYFDAPPRYLYKHALQAVQ